MPTHGSLTKAGKVRSQTPKIPAKERHSPIPRFRVKRNYEKRVLLKREVGQNWMRPRGRRFR
ncbi:30S ribosomal protein S30e [Candidatus Hecatella orcuttiae]|jgi:small subunit ribosomal protein S30e|uniref:30S ribosomal protein S30e n=1 Tax=Candidatus Hecatella orcuttiae TaxID=1935119 RepID=UPI002867B2E6|nr:30S ribosomal protein S30e [Candidatus Hecatella orcuttiae]